MSPINRREFLAAAAAMGASLAWRAQRAVPSDLESAERRDLYPHGVASGDPYPTSVLLWTRRPPRVAADGIATRLTAEVAEDEQFHRVVAKTAVRLSANADWTCRVLAAGLKPGRVYWYRFTDEHGFSSRVGRTRTAPAYSDPRPAKFVFVSCQNANDGACNAYRRMIFEDEARPASEQLGFVLHLGDFVYEIVWYPEDRPQGMYDRKIRDIVRYANGEKHSDFHVPTTVEDYRALYGAYLLDPDLQDARARWPFVYMWDNHEFSWKGWQSQQDFGSGTIPAQRRKVAANQAWFEYQPARVAKPHDPSLDAFTPPQVSDKALSALDDHGLGLDPDNLAAIHSLQIFRTIRWGKNVELILTDNRSYRSEPMIYRAESAPFQPKGFPYFYSQHAAEILDAGRAYNDGHPPDTITFNGVDLPNPRKDAPPQSMLGGAQKAWFLERLRKSTAPWKIWGNTVAMLDWRTDFHNLPAGTGPSWPVDGYAQLGDEDWSTYISERNEILEMVRREKITGFATIAGDRHSFLAGVLSPTLPPKAFKPVGVEFVVGSISAPGIFEAASYGIAKDHPLRAFYLHDAGEKPVQPAINLSLLHGVRASLALQRTGSVSEAMRQGNPEVAPHLWFADTGGHGYAVVDADAESLAVEFVAIPRPIERSDRADGGPLAYRVIHRVKRWAAGDSPSLAQSVVEGAPPLATRR